METSPMLQQTTPVARPARTARLKRAFTRHEFDNSELERLYRRYVYKLQQASVGHVLLILALLCAILIVLHFYYIRHFNVQGIYLSVQCVLFIILYIFINTRFMKEYHFKIVCVIVLLFLFGFAILGFPLDFTYLGWDLPRPLHTPVQGAWEVMYVVFVIYAMMPLRTYLAAILGIILPASHVIVTILVANNLPELLWRQVCIFL